MTKEEKKRAKRIKQAVKAQKVAIKQFWKGLRKFSKSKYVHEFFGEIESRKRGAA